MGKVVKKRGMGIREMGVWGLVKEYWSIIGGLAKYKNRRKWKRITIQEIKGGKLVPSRVHNLKITPFDSVIQ